MANHPQFDEIREEIEAKQRTVLFEDGLRAGKSVDDFLWKGDPNAKPIQRAGLVVFGLTFWLLGILLIAIIGSLIGSAFVLVAIRLFWNAFLRPNKISKDEKDQQG